MEITLAGIEKVLGLLAETPRRLTTLSRGLENSRLHLKPDKEAWSTNDILAHLRSCADVWGKTIERMLAEDNPTLPHISPRTWLRKTDYPELAFYDSLQTFVDQRTALLDTLKNLELEAWSRGAMIKERKHTVFSQARRMAHHENEHCTQIEVLLKGKER